ncbi:hypothetical protein HYV82_05580 [Candidatus Woesearchaeota archaeon]|nr:hypothetical protein [Candidatus Woesearchaeota archaeon]
MSDYNYPINDGQGRVPHLMFIGQELGRALSEAGAGRLYSHPGNYDYILGGKGLRVLLKGDVGMLSAKIERNETAGVTEPDILRSLERIMMMGNSSFPLGGRPAERVTS